ncbi:hypothetical protein Cgig2_020924 [Carnegiea gigantea]|uniref:Uncharacterized protein n=1 Tax=Carnegiea gigantea TaxID=171969 RepID=A0A9Q1GPK9_9CARY|nr:hypothetical protein Cgig2_020924 [Carnegiea gigantea]
MSGEELHQHPIQLIIDSSTTCNTATTPSAPRMNRNGSFSSSTKSLSSILARLHAGYFRISLSLGGQALLWKILSQAYDQNRREGHESIPLLNVPSFGAFLLWSLAVSVLVSLSFLYVLRCFFHFHLVKVEFLHHISVLGNLVGARAAAQMGWQENAVCLFSLGMAHYLVLFVTLYQRLSGGDRLPAMLRPVFFLFFAVPSMASLAWSSISGSYDTGSKMLFFLSLFLFASLACRPILFKKSMRKFNVAWWAYSFPLTMLALASAEYTEEVKDRIAAALMLILSGLSLVVFIGLLLLTVLNAAKLLCENDPVLSFAKDPTA